MRGVCLCWRQRPGLWERFDYVYDERLDSGALGWCWRGCYHGSFLFLFSFPNDLSSRTNMMTLFDVIGPHWPLSSCSSDNHQELAFSFRGKWYLAV